MTRRRRVAFSAVVAALAASPLGCSSGEGVSSHTVPTPQKIDEPPLQERTGDYRILGAVYGLDADQSWFFKFSGKATDIAQHEAAFDQMLASMRFPRGVAEEPEFAVPAGWVREGKQELGPVTITATLFPNPSNRDLKITLSQSGGGLPQNLDRWANMQLGGGKVAKREMPKIGREIDAGGVKGLRIDLRGPNDPNAKKMPGGK